MLDSPVIMKYRIKLPRKGYQPACLIEDLFHLFAADIRKPGDDEIALYLYREAVFPQDPRDKVEPPGPFEDIRSASGKAEINVVVPGTVAAEAIHHIEMVAEPEVEVYIVTRYYRNVIAEITCAVRNNVRHLHHAREKILGPQ